MISKKCLLGVAVLILLAFSAQAFAQGSSTGSFQGTVKDTSGGVVIGAQVTVKNTETNVENKSITNNTGTYSVPGLLPGYYKITVEKENFNTSVTENIRLGNGISKIDVKLEAGKKTDVVEVNIKAENIILENGPSVGVVLPEDAIAKLPLVNSNVLDLVKVMGGVVMTESPIFAADDTTLAGLSAANVNVQKDGVTANNIRWVTGMNTPVNLNPEMISEFKVIVTPVDAEMGRGSGQIQVVTRSGGNAYRGSVVWNVQNTAFSANTWSSNKSGTKPTWRNQNEWIAQGSGPIIKNKTFIFALFDYTRSLSREDINPQMPTACARKGIYRYFDGYNSGSALYVANDAASPTRSSPNTRAVVYANGVPRNDLIMPTYMSTMAGYVAGAPAALRAINVFGDLDPNWNPVLDPNCDQIALVTDKANTYYNFPVAAGSAPAGKYGINYSTYQTTGAGSKYNALRTRDTTGYVGKFLDIIPLPNNYRVGDGLNWGGYSWTRRNLGIDNVYGIGETPNRKQINIRVDHNFSSRHRANVAYTYEKNRGDDAMRILPYPQGFGGTINRTPQTLSTTLTSTLKPSLLNELRVGYMRTDSWVNGPMLQPETGAELRKLVYDLLPTGSWPSLQASKIDIPVLVSLPNFTLGSSTYFHPYGGGRGNMGVDWGSTDPRLTIADTITWQFGRHSLRIGGETQRTSSDYKENGVKSFFGGSTPSVFPIVNGGTSSSQPQITAFDTTTACPSGYPNLFYGYCYTAGYTSWTSPVVGYNFPGQVGSGTSHNISGAKTMMDIFAGSVQNVSQFFFINDPLTTRYNDITDGEVYKRSQFFQNQINWFAQDNWRVTDDLTLQLGMRYEWYGVPYLGNGLTAGFLGGGLSSFGLSGRGFSTWMPTKWQPGKNQPITDNYKNCVDASGQQVECELSKLAFIGPDSQHPEQNFYNDDYNNYGPVVGFAYTLPWGGKGKTVLRGGLQISYLTFGRADNAISNMPGSTMSFSAQASGNAYMTLADVKNYIPVKVPSYVQTPAVRPATPVDQRSQSLTAYDPNIRTPYTQSLNLRLTRTIGSSLTLDLIYAGNLSRKSATTVNLNAPNMINTGLFQDLINARAGRPTPVLDTLLKGINIGGATNGPSPYGPIGTTLANGTYQSAGLQLRNTTLTAGGVAIPNQLANGELTAIVNWLATANFTSTSAPWNPGITAAPTGVAGQLLRVAGAPENYIYSNPQYSNVTWNANMNKSNYHSMQAQITMRPSHGLMLSATYTFSKTMGYSGISDYGNRDQEWGQVSGRKHALTSYGTFDLPFGPNRWLLSSVSPNVLGRIIGGWQLSWIHTMQSGAPQTITGDINYLWGGNMMNRVKNFDTSSGYVTWKPGAGVGDYYNFEYNNVADPQCANSAMVTTQNGLAGKCQLKALADSKGTIYFVNAVPGERPNYSRNTFSSPMQWNTDGAVSKSVRVAEGKSFQIRVDATNIFNHAQPANPNYGLGANSMWKAFGLYLYTRFGEISSKSGNRKFQARLRFDF